MRACIRTDISILFESMKQAKAIQRFAALAHDARLSIFRALVKAGPEGLPAGEIATRLGLSPSGLSFHVAILERAGLLASRRQGRSIIYMPCIVEAVVLGEFLTRDCCGGRPEDCVPRREQRMS